MINQHNTNGITIGLIWSAISKNNISRLKNE